MLRQNMLDAISLKEISLFVQKAISYIKSVYPDLYKEIEATKDVSDLVVGRLKDVALEFAKLFKQEVEKE